MVGRGIALHFLARGSRSGPKSSDLLGDHVDLGVIAAWPAMRGQQLRRVAGDRRRDRQAQSSASRRADTVEQGLPNWIIGGCFPRRRIAEASVRGSQAHPRRLPTAPATQQVKDAIISQGNFIDPTSRGRCPLHAQQQDRLRKADRKDRAEAAVITKPARRFGLRRNNLRLWPVTFRSAPAKNRMCITISALLDGRYLGIVLAYSCRSRELPQGKNEKDTEHGLCSLFAFPGGSSDELR